MLNQLWDLGSHWTDWNWADRQVLLWIASCTHLLKVLEAGCFWFFLHCKTSVEYLLFSPASLGSSASCVSLQTSSLSMLRSVSSLVSLLSGSFALYSASPVKKKKNGMQKLKQGCKCCPTHKGFTDYDGVTNVILSIRSRATPFHLLYKKGGKSRMLKHPWLRELFWPWFNISFAQLLASERFHWA